MHTGLAGKVALVAAASKGLGRAIAEDFAAEGAAVAICAPENAGTSRSVKVSLNSLGEPETVAPTAGTA